MSIFNQIRNNQLISNICYNFAELSHVVARYWRENFIFPLTINKIEETPLDQLGMHLNLSRCNQGFPLPPFCSQEIVTLTVFLEFTLCLLQFCDLPSYGSGICKQLCDTLFPALRQSERPSQQFSHCRRIVCPKPRFRRCSHYGINRRLLQDFFIICQEGFEQGL